MNSLANAEVKKRRKIYTKRPNLLSRMGNTDLKFNRSRCQLNKKKSTGNTEQMDVDEAISIHFHEDIFMNILSRLPVRSLLQFKCVSKPWKKLISDPYFKMMHLKHAKNDQNSQKLIISQCLLKNGFDSIYCCPLSSDQLAVDDVQILDWPSSPNPRLCSILCSCDGLVFIAVAYHKVQDYILLLWNPCTRESIVLPCPENLLDTTCRFGFGYDSSSGDYKILMIQMPEFPNEILALKSGSWRKIDKDPRGFYNVMSATHPLPFVHDAFHWIGKLSNHSVVSFSISNEVYGEIPLSEQILCFVSGTIGVSVLEGMLCVHCCSSRQNVDTFKIWVMKEYGVKESWNALFTIEDSWMYRTIAVYRFANGELLFNSTNLKREVRLFRTSSGPFGLWPQDGVFQHGIVFTESLISPKSLTYAANSCSH